MKALIPFLLSLLLIGCAAKRTDRAAEELNIREAMFRYQFASNGSGQQQTANCYYLAIYDAAGKENDPDDAFMKRFAGHKPAVKRRSECETSFEKGVVSKMNGELGLIVNPGVLRWISETEAEIYGYYYEANLSGGGGHFSLQKIDGRWKVVGQTTQWIS